MLALLIKAALF